MKIAIESNDGATIKSPFTDTTGYLIFDVDENSIGNVTYCEVNKSVSRSKERLIVNGTLSQCSTIITRGMDKKYREQLKNKGIDIFVTFNTSAKSALYSYLKERRINQPVLS